jgi:hypothetical protein
VALHPAKKIESSLLSPFGGTQACGRLLLFATQRKISAGHLAFFRFLILPRSSRGWLLLFPAAEKVSKKAAAVPSAPKMTRPHAGPAKLASLEQYRGFYKLPGYAWLHAIF